MCGETQVVLVTGASGFVGAAVTLELLKQGYKAKGTVRSQEKADAFDAVYPEHTGSITWSIVPGTGYRRARCRSRIAPRVALPLLCQRPGKGDAPTGAAGLAAGINLRQGYRPGYTYSELDWNPITWEQVMMIGDPAVAYLASKKFADQAAWNYMSTHAPKFALTRICPPMIFGPPMQPVERMKELTMSTADAAKLHVDALSHPASANQRYLAIGGHYSYAQVAHIIAQHQPELATAGKVTPSVGEPATHFDTDSGKAETEFEMGWSSINVLEIPWISCWNWRRSLGFE
ncbi:NADP-binding protein [Dacryopinax primogenitus]|uniref:NADP-binding protein n=1 Tax=Dacryopinax primogenitus (strain DJM 731) TaxID=1858805 RepID=M5FX84_DACPD|nr:NADP-binding protein [Dacryopinax primogenitus]EJT98086.1 NADP-binding protein [Dacryopinax primogenitus]